jgi:hypothetical protein
MSSRGVVEPLLSDLEIKAFYQGTTLVGPLELKKEDERVRVFLVTTQGEEVFVEIKACSESSMSSRDVVESLLSGL